MKEKVKIDLHVHSRYSHDSNTKVSDIIKFAQNKGLSGVSISDHNCVTGALKGYEHTKNWEDFIVIPSVELSTQFGDIILMFVSEDIKSRDFYDIVELAQENDYLIMLPHPTEVNIALQIGDKVDAIEVINGGKRITQNVMSFLIQAKLNKTRVAGSDAHMLNNIGKCHTLFNSIDENTIRQDLMKGTTEVRGLLSTTTNIFSWMNRRFLNHQIKHP